MTFIRTLSISMVALATLAFGQAAEAQQLQITAQSAAGFTGTTPLLYDFGNASGFNGAVSSSSIAFGTAGTISFTGGSGVFHGNQSGVVANPSGISGNYLAAQPGGVVDLKLNSAQTSLGLLAGSVDTYNTAKFYLGGQLVGTLSGSDITANANGAQDPSGTYFVTVGGFAKGFDEVVFTSTSPAFEFSLYASNANPAPLPSFGTNPLSGLALVAAMGGLYLIRRRTA